MKGWSLADMPGYESFNFKTATLQRLKFSNAEGYSVYESTAPTYHVITPTSLLSEVEEEGRGQSDASQGADEDLLGGGTEHGHGAGHLDSQNETDYPTEILVTF